MSEITNARACVRLGVSARRIAGVVLVALVLMSASLAMADQRDPRLPSLFSGLLHSTDPEQAHQLELRIWSIWLTTTDDRVAALLDEGVRAMASGQLEEAVARFDSIVELAPGFAEGWNKRATALYLQRDFDASMRDIQRTLALEPRHFGAISGMGLILMDSGNPVGAMSAFEAVLRINPNAPAARHYLEQLRKATAAGGA